MPPQLRAALLLALFAGLVAGVPAPLPELRLPPPVTRVARYEDIPSEFASVYKVIPQCPDTLRFGSYTEDARRVAQLEMDAIQENNALCTGPFPMAIVSEATLEQPGLLKALNLTGFRDALTVNTQANNLVTSSNTSMLAGWHAGERTCSGNVYPPTSIYFIIREEMKPFKISLQRGTMREILTIPRLLKSLLIVAPNSNICLLVDRSSAPGSNPTLMSISPNGTTTTAILSATGPTPAASPSPVDASGLTVPSPTSTTLPQSPSSAPPSPSSSPPAAPSPSPSIPPSLSPNPAFVSLPDPTPADDSSTSPDASAEVIPTVIPSDDTTGAANGVPPGDSTEPSPNDVGQQRASDGASACFPAAAVVTLASGALRTMAQLAVGDRILADGTAAFSDIVLFTHREPASRSHFLRLTTASGRCLTVSPGHYIYANGGQLRAVMSLAVGDELDLAESGSSSITSVENVSALGLYNPQTASGSIVVDGFKASTYTTAVHPTIAHTVLMAPVRWLYSLSPRLAAAFARCFDHGSPLFARLLPGGPSVAA